MNKASHARFSPEPVLRTGNYLRQLPEHLEKCRLIKRRDSLGVFANINVYYFGAKTDSKTILLFLLLCRFARGFQLNLLASMPCRSHCKVRILQVLLLEIYLLILGI